ncbi:MAG: hypothetical protein ACJ72H_09400 [Candidatus Sulfotelmatobacter sp.]
MKTTRRKRKQRSSALQVDSGATSASTGSNNSASGVSSRAAGEVLSGCRLDLPKNDVVEFIEFERFFRLNLVYNDLSGPATLPVEGINKRLLETVPFSAAAGVWAAFKGRTNDVRKSYALGPNKPIREAPGNIAPGINGQQSDLANLPLALYLPFRQEWKLGGYSRGRLVNSFTLVPLEEQTIEVFKWDRLTSSIDSSTSFDSEDTNESSSTRRDTVDVARDVQRQAGFETNSQGKVGFKVGVVNADLSAGFNARTGVNDGEKDTRNAITEATTRSTSRVRTSRTLKVVESREQGQETRTTRKLRNPNNCHAMTVAFSEILANYTVNTFVRADAARLVVLVDPLAVVEKSITAAIIREHETPLKLALMDKQLVDGFDAARYLDARARACEILCTGCICDGTVETAPESTQLTNLREATVEVAKVLAAINGYSVVFPLSILALPTPAQPPVDDVRRYAFHKALQTYAPSLLGDLTALSLGVNAASVTVTQIESVNRILNGVSTEDLVKFIADPPTSDKVKQEIYLYLLTVVIHEPISAGITLGVLWARLNGLGTFDDFGLLSSINAFRGAYGAWQAWLADQAANDEKLAALRRIEKQERDLRVLEAFPLRATAEAGERLDALLAHLNDSKNIDHYRFAMYNERAGATDSTLLQLALAGLVEPIPVGIVDNLLAVPVRLANGSKLRQFFDSTMTDLVANPPNTSEDYILPTAALYAESVVGQCSSCEDAIERSTELDLQHKKLENGIRELEEDRLEARLKAHPPLLDREDLAVPSIKVELVRDAPARSPEG